MSNEWDWDPAARSRRAIQADVRRDWQVCAFFAALAIIGWIGGELICGQPTPGTGTSALVAVFMGAMARRRANILQPPPAEDTAKPSRWWRCPDPIPANPSRWQRFWWGIEPQRAETPR